MTYFRTKANLNLKGEDGQWVSFLVQIQNVLDTLMKANKNQFRKKRCNTQGKAGIHPEKYWNINIQ